MSEKLTLERWAALDQAASPGPWGVSERLSGSENHKGFRLYEGGEHWFFAEVYPKDEDGVGGRANAAFMAASRQAPTRLLAALRGLAAEWDTKTCNCGHSYQLGCCKVHGYESAADQLRALIEQTDLSEDAQ